MASTSTRNPAQHSTADAALSVCLKEGYLPLEDIVRLSCCSSGSAQLCMQLAEEGNAAKAILVQAVQAACAAHALCFQHAAGHPVSRFLSPQIAWLVKQADTQLLQRADTMTALMSTPNMAPNIAAALVTNGACFTYQQLLQAARSLVPGLDVWPRMYRHLELPRPEGMPRIAEDLCCGDDVDALVSKQRSG